MKGVITISDFFGKEEPKLNMEENQNPAQNPVEPEAFKIGEKAYTKDELESLVAIGEMGRDLETKWNTKLDRLAPEYTKSRQELADLKKSFEEQKNKEVETKINTGSQLSPEEIRARALEEAKELGIVTKTDVFDYVREFIEGRELLKDINSIVDDAEDKGIKTSAQAILDHMKNEGFRNPQKAFKDLYEEPLKKWEESQISSLRPEGMSTITASPAGNRMPIPQKIDRSNLKEAVSAALGGE